jgi:hypothetical protein
MESKIAETDWENVFDAEVDINSACSNFTKTFLNIAKTCIPASGVTIRSDDKVSFELDLRRESRKRDRLRQICLGRKRKQPRKKLKRKETNLARYDYNLTIMKSPKPATDTIYPHIKF